MQLATMHERDSRTMNHMDEQTKLVHARLERWGRWGRDTGIRAWPAVTLLARVIEEGPHGAQSAGGGVSEMPEDVAQVDAAVAHLGEVDKRVIRKYYLEWSPPEVMARTLHMSVPQFRAVLSRGRWRVGGYLAAL